jgi:hypothetical protein
MIVLVKWRGRERKQPCHNLGYYSSIFLEGLRKRRLPSGQRSKPVASRISSRSATRAARMFGALNSGSQTLWASPATNCTFMYPSSLHILNYLPINLKTDPNKIINLKCFLTLVNEIKLFKLRIYAFIIKPSQIFI